MNVHPGHASQSWKTLRVLAAACLVAAASLAVGAMVVTPLSAQAPSTPSSPERSDIFEKASITPSRSVGTTRINMAAGGRFEATNASVRMLIRFAYQVQDFQIAGAPRWIDSDRFDIVATRASELAPQLGGDPRLRLRVRALLADRFKLKVERETRDLPMYELVMMRRDGKPGPQLRVSKTDCAELARGFARGNPSPGTLPPAELMRCGIRLQPGTLTAGGVTLLEFATSLSQLAGRAVENKTGLTGTYDIQLDYFHELAPPPSRGPVEPAADDRRADIEPSIFAALQEQLGLRLDPRRGPVDLLIISKVERPSQD